MLEELDYLVIDSIPRIGAGTVALGDGTCLRSGMSRAYGSGAMSSLSIGPRHDTSNYR